jgi:hypothetical protein
VASWFSTACRSAPGQHPVQTGPRGFGGPADIIAGTKNSLHRQQPPNVDASGNVQDAGAEAVDDLWHAAVNGRGGFANADVLPSWLRPSPTYCRKSFCKPAPAPSPTNGGQLSLANKWLQDKVQRPRPRERLGGRRQEISARPHHRGSSDLIWSATAKLDAQAAVVGT